MSNYPKMNTVASSLFGAPLGSPEQVKPGVLGVVGMPSDWTHSSRCLLYTSDAADDA